MSTPDFIKRILLVVLVGLLGIVVGIAALLGTSAISDRPPLFLLAGLATFCLVYFLGLVLVTRGIDPPRRRRIRASVFCAGVAVVVAVFTATALLPLSDPRLSPAPANGQQFWQLSTGSTIAYVRVPAEGDARPTPASVLHGGPGVPDMKGDAGYFGQLAQDGFDVYVYDQVGRGWSSRLADPRGYTLERDVADLEDIRRQIGAEQMVLIGHSYGGKLAAAYVAAHPEHVAKIVLSAPDDPAPFAASTSMVGRLRLREQFAVYALLLQPRALLGYALLQVNPRAAYAFAADAEMDARFDRVYNRTRAALHCAGKPPGPRLSGLGFYAHYYPQSPASPPPPDILPALAGQTIPALVIKGRCDYLSWSSAVAYASVLPDARLVYLTGAGHNAYQDEPERFMAAVRAFLLDQPLPDPPYEGRLVPEDYEGPP